MDSGYRTTDFDYDYPPDAVAQYPLEERDASRLLVLERETGGIRHLKFGDLPALFESGDVLVRNTSRVIPARLIGTRDNGREAEVLLVHAEADGTWQAMVHPGGKLKLGRTIRFGDDAVAEVVEVYRGGLRRLAFQGKLDVAQLMRRYGRVPLPPYIERAPSEDDKERYQTVYAQVNGSVAAPTAGLHFTAATFEAIRGRGVAVADVLLHIGPGTFKPVEVQDPSRHIMHAEWYEISEEAARTINEARDGGGRVWAVGTTAARVLEAVAVAPNAPAARCEVAAGCGWTDLFIRPPYDFRMVDALLTNFHLPRSTLLMLVAAFAGYERTMAAYREAIQKGYRLFSYGDAMVIV